MSIKSRFIQMSSIGFSLGVFVGLFIAAISSIVSGDDSFHIYGEQFAQKIGNVTLSFTIELLCYGLLGVVGMGVKTLTYDNDKIPLLKATVMHFIIVMVVFVFVSNLLCWFETGDIIGRMIFYGCFILVYAMIWAIMSAIYKKEINTINNKLKQIQKEN
ncbi:MAG: DUF3021 domain-containing protein [Lachnospiraceae bacterium]|nr:DUF3021 domain-containing protein [Lachnospiraceae bacterium]